MKIKHTIHIILFLFTVVPLLGFGTFMVYENNRNVEGIMEENLAAASGAQILDIENFCETKKENLTVVCQLDLVRDAIFASLGKEPPLSERDADYLRNTLISRVNANAFSESLTIIDKDLKVVSSSFSSPVGEISGLKDSNPEFLTGEFIISDILNPENSGSEHEIVAAIMGIYDSDELIGYAVEEINLFFFDQIRKETNLWKNGTLYLLDGNEKMITAGDGTEESRQEYVSNEDDRKGYSEAFQKVDMDAQPQGEIKYKVWGKTYITYYSKIDYTNWLILVSVELSHFQESEQTYLLLILTTCAAVSILFIVLNHFITCKLTEPAQRIRDTLRNIQKNQDYRLRIENCGKDEIGALSDEVNILLEYIEQENQMEKERQIYLTLKAERDPLTGIYNRKAIEKQIKQMLKNAGDDGKRIAVAIVDVDDFKDYNTKYGHAGGDRVLKHIAGVLTQADNSTAGRIGGDEFILGMEAPAELPKLEELFSQLLDQLNGSYYDPEMEEKLPIPCSIGIATASEPGISYETIFHQADKALYAAKAAGKNTYRFYQQS